MSAEHFLIGANGWVPNNPRLPVVLHHGVAPGAGDALADHFDRMFAEHGWRSQWRDGIYDYHHYHSTAHEALGVFAGNATLELGGPEGRLLMVSPGDVLMLPAGTGHRRVSACPDFQVVGAYPVGQDWDICRQAPDALTYDRMRALPDPTDPVTGDPVEASPTD
jgi:uncharacterized protein YjlB